MDAEHLTERLREGFGSSAKVTTRRAGRIFQIELPAYLADGDAANIFVRPEPGGYVVVTDLGHTCMRLSYVRALTGTVTDAVEQIATRHGLRFEEGQIFARVPLQDLFTTALALAQTQAEAETAIATRATKEVSAEQFRTLVREVLREAFRDRVRLNYTDKELDPEGLYPLDAVVEGPKPLAVAVIPSEADAERAVATKFMLDSKLREERPGVKWLALPRNLEKLPKKTQARVEHAYHVPLRVIQHPNQQLAGMLRQMSVSA